MSRAKSVSLTLRPASACPRGWHRTLPEATDRPPPRPGTGGAWTAWRPGRLPSCAATSALIARPISELVSHCGPSRVYLGCADFAPDFTLYETRDPVADWDLPACLTLPERSDRDPPRSGLRVTGSPPAEGARRSSPRERRGRDGGTRSHGDRVAAAPRLVREDGQENTRERRRLSSTGIDCADLPRCSPVTA